MRRRYGKIYKSIKPVHVFSQYSIVLTKGSRCTFIQYLTFESLNSNTKVGYERSSSLIKKTLARWESVLVVRLLGLNKLYTLFECFYGRFSKASKCPLCYWQYFNSDDWEQQLPKLLQKIWSCAIRTDWKTLSSIFYHLCASGNDFPSGCPLSIFSTTRPFLAQYRKQYFYYTSANWDINLIIGYGNHA